MMLRIPTILAAALLALSACVAGPSGRAKDAPPLEAVASVDIARYMGLWYEIARYPTSFQKDCEGTTAQYTLRDDSRVDVVNTCRFGTKDGEPRSAEAVARVMEGSNGARVFVNFAPIPLPAGRGNYWIIHLDEGYQHALIGEPSGRFLWMLSRTPTVTPEVRAELDAAAKAKGYDLSMLKETLQEP
ncbi:lipocalin family protein [Hyphomonas sp.]|uniref:lipocalin family protein n=1 Tax=Hyphomonas sp. TaxID=87 RepID=UPI0025C2829A|nr:lipocalin family protein [Hyphomonas sp.]MBI1399975.1 lipocalin [Hyphomonas sp.]